MVSRMATEDEVAAKFNDLMIATLNEAMYLLKNGSPDYQMQMIKATMPSISKTLDTDVEATSITELRQRQQDMMAGIIEQLKPDVRAIVEAEVIVEDTR